LSPAALQWILIVNGLVVLVSAASSIVAMAKPSLILPHGMAVNGGTRLYANAYGARAVPLAAVAVALVVMGDQSAVTPVLAVAGLAQIGDCAIGVQQRNRGMAIGAGLAAALHLASAWSFHTG
jgi:hypothetical protein